MKSVFQRLGHAMSRSSRSKDAGTQGQTLVEYSLILAFVATMIVAIGLLVGGANGLLGDIESTLAEVFG